MLPATLPARIILSALLATLPLTGPVTSPPETSSGQESPQQAEAQPPAGPRRPADTAPRAGEALLLVTPGRQEVAVGETLRLVVAVLGARSVRSFPATVEYDPEILELVGVEAGSAWESGLPPVLLHDSSRPGETTLGISRLGPAGSAVRGIGALVELRFRALSRGDAEVTLERFALLGAGVDVQPARARGARIAVR